VVTVKRVPKLLLATAGFLVRAGVPACGAKAMIGVAGVLAMKCAAA
jgi:hypothetical protein